MLDNQIAELERAEEDIRSREAREIIELLHWQPSDCFVFIAAHGEKLRYGSGLAEAMELLAQYILEDKGHDLLCEHHAARLAADQVEQSGEAP